MANTLCGFDVILISSTQIQAGTAEGFPTVVQTFDTFMDKIKVATDMANIEIPRATREMSRKQKDGKRLQDTMDISVLTERSFDTSKRSSTHCCHYYLLPIGMSTNNINIHNTKCREDYKVTMKA